MLRRCRRGHGANRESSNTEAWLQTLDWNYLRLERIGSKPGRSFQVAIQGESQNAHSWRLTPISGDKKNSADSAMAVENLPGESLSGPPYSLRFCARILFGSPPELPRSFVIAEVLLRQLAESSQDLGVVMLDSHRHQLFQWWIGVVLNENGRQ